MPASPRSPPAHEGRLRTGQRASGHKPGDRPCAPCPPLACCGRGAAATERRAVVAVAAALQRARTGHSAAKQLARAAKARRSLLS